MLYSLTYTNSIPAGFAGIAKAWMIKIRPEHRDDNGLLAHEKEHVRQFWTCPLHPLLLYIPAYQKWAEVRAYRVQYETDPEHLEDYVRFLMNEKGRYRYNPMSEKEARKVLL